MVYIWEGLQMKTRREEISELKKLYEFVNGGLGRVGELELGRSSEWPRSIKGSLEFGRFGS